jgi:hypothetical protein
MPGLFYPQLQYRNLRNDVQNIVLITLMNSIHQSKKLSPSSESVSSEKVGQFTQGRKSIISSKLD